MRTAVKIKIYKMAVKPTVVFGSGTRTIIELGMKKQCTWDRKILRRMYGSVAGQEKWRIRTNGELIALYKDLDIATDIKKKRMEWTGYVVRIDHGRTVKKIFESKPERSRRRGRPTL